VIGAGALGFSASWVSRSQWTTRALTAHPKR
jgi:hypothetical protein